MNAFAHEKVTTYTQNDVATSNRLNLLVMLYDAAVKNMFLAIKKIDEKDIPGKGVYISKALAIIHEFRNTLDFGPNPELARQLDRLYGFISDRLIDANIGNDKRPLADALRVTNTLRSAWSELAERTKNQAPEDGALGEVARGTNDANVVRISV